MWKLSKDPIFSAADEPEDVTIDFLKGIPVKLTSKSTGTQTDPTPSLPRRQRSRPQTRRRPH